MNIEIIDEEPVLDSVDVVASKTGVPEGGDRIRQAVATRTSALWAINQTLKITSPKVMPENTITIMLYGQAACLAAIGVQLTALGDDAGVAATKRAWVGVTKRCAGEITTKGLRAILCELITAWLPLMATGQTPPAAPVRANGSADDDAALSVRFPHKESIQNDPQFTKKGVGL